MSTPMSQARAFVPRFAEAAVERARLTVVPRTAHKAPRVPFVSLVSLLLVTGVVGLLLFNTHMQQASFVATSMEEQASVLAAKEESLRMQLHRLRDPQHVAAEAKKLGMVPATSPAFLRLSDGEVLGQPAPAVAEDALRIAPLPAAKPKSLRPDPVIVELPSPGTRGRSAQARDTRGPHVASADPAPGSRRNDRNKPDVAQGRPR